MTHFFRVCANSSFIKPQKKSHRTAVILGLSNIDFRAGSFVGEAIPGEATVGREKQGRRKANPEVNELVTGRGNRGSVPPGNACEPCKTNHDEGGMGERTEGGSKRSQVLRGHVHCGHQGCHSSRTAGRERRMAVGSLRAPREPSLLEPQSSPSYVVLRLCSESLSAISKTQTRPQTANTTCLCGFSKALVEGHWMHQTRCFCFCFCFKTGLAHGKPRGCALLLSQQ